MSSEKLGNQFRWDSSFPNSYIPSRYYRSFSQKHTVVNNLVVYQVCIRLASAIFSKSVGGWRTHKSSSTEDPNTFLTIF